jgi:hypothetical protein
MIAWSISRYMRSVHCHRVESRLSAVVMHRVSILCRTLQIVSAQGVGERRMVIITFEHTLTDAECFAALKRGESIQLGEYSIREYSSEEPAVIMTDLPLRLFNKTLEIISPS